MKIKIHPGVIRMPSPQNIVITGSTRGIGYGLAEAFLQSGCSVVVSGRNEASTTASAERLTSEHGPGRIHGLACNVADPQAVESLWEGAVARLGRVDIWVNNAGHAGEMGMVWERPADEVQSVIETNVIGVIFGSQVAMRGMKAQGGGAIYNMEGMGSDGRKHAGLSLYGTTKYAVHYFTESLAMEAKDTNLLVGSLRPGMVATDMIRNRYKDRPEEWERAKRIFNIIAEPVDKVTPWLARQMLDNRKNSVTLSYSSTPKMLWKFLRSPFVKNDVFEA
jgi:NAD(P)-dependent dehydrogenase (short-subunit alcohol dehydrogenase family)